MRYREFVLRNRDWIFKWTYRVQFSFAFLGIGCAAIIQFELMALFIVLSFLCHVLIASYSGIVKQDFQRVIKQDPYFGLDGSTKRRLRRKTERKGEVKKIFNGDI